MTLSQDPDRREESHGGARSIPARDKYISKVVINKVRERYTPLRNINEGCDCDMI